MINGRVTGNVASGQTLVGINVGSLYCGSKQAPSFYIPVDYHYHWIECITRKVTEGVQKSQALDQCQYATKCHDAFKLCSFDGTQHADPFDRQ